MDSMRAFRMSEAARASGSRCKVFDWDKAAQLIKDRGATNARAGLQIDWEFTGGDILTDGKPTPEEKTYTYLASVWATPELEIDGELMECWRYVDDSPGWDSGTYWPESALAILNA